MVRRNQEGKRYLCGGIIGLAAFIDEHHKALEADLIKYGYEVKDVGRSLSWNALQSFLAYPEPDSALTRELEPEIYKWSSRYKTNAILADIFDVLAQINANIVALATHKAAKTPPSYPRSGKKKDGRHIGDGEALPAPELRKMFVNKRRQRANNG